MNSCFRGHQFVKKGAKEVLELLALPRMKLAFGIQRFESCNDSSLFASFRKADGKAADQSGIHVPLVRPVAEFPQILIMILKVVMRITG